MLEKLFTKPISLEIADQTLNFNSELEFEFALNGRTSVPARKFSDLFSLSLKQLKSEAATIKEVEKRFVNILSEAFENPGIIERSLRELDAMIFSSDHGWREIISALNEGGEELNPFRRLALVKYMQYLASRQDMIKYVYSEKSKQVSEESVEAQDFSEGDAMKSTIILDQTVIAAKPKTADLDAEDADPNALERLPKGEVVEIQLLPGKEVPIQLSKHVCYLVGGESTEFIDNDGKKHTLINGRNVVGRDSVSTIPLKSDSRDISRMHLIIEKKDTHRILLTDISSHGTFIPAKFIQDHSNTV